jgi:hypothetical protein
MRVYYLDDPLSDDEIADVSEMLEVSVELVRVPSLMPVPQADGTIESAISDSEEAAKRLLRSAGILADYGFKVGVVIPVDMMAWGALSEAIHDLTGVYPFAIQTERQRQAIGNSGGLRVFDMQGMMGG